MSEKCLYCYKDIIAEKDFHEKCSLEFFGIRLAPKIPYDRADMSKLAKKVVERRIAVPGVQAKLSMSVEEALENNEARLTVVGALGGNFILKPPSDKYQEMPVNEHLTMRLAEVFGLSVVPSSLVRLKSKELAYITKRIDRTFDGKKVHMLDMFQITEAFDKYKGSMERIGKAIGKYSENTLLDQISFFEISIFCYLTGNNDMHLKNFSMINSSIGWKLSQAYDLLNVSILLPEDREEMALSICGKKSKLSKDHFLTFGTKLGLNLKQINGVFNRLEKSYPVAISMIDNSFLSEEMRDRYKSIFNKRYNVLNQ